MICVLYLKAAHPLLLLRDGHKGNLFEECIGLTVRFNEVRDEVCFRRGKTEASTDRRSHASPHGFVARAASGAIRSTLEGFSLAHIVDQGDEGQQFLRRAMAI
jgi:hypothetical protein